ncbi:hypothetical protein [Candidatus Erwinia dacicola]|uniref:Uncharacterized protein n=1 Tax=Candidatus Erwinia dacicola TaxID=252393 RepID=A0A1E7Z1B6_9GAMM|nr:hypothetical protein [Candidatus Erwinia dacicola]OFC62586.1 hypothetical protein BBW68_09095 [Candidatus Erwinia dacicola]RAP70871.1 hypothetical protein ACZ87_02324 [Candidatus Erwinia dacicola]
MKNNLKTGVVEVITGNAVTFKFGDKREYIELNDEVTSGLSIGDTVRIVYTNGRMVRVFNVSTEILYETDVNLTRSGYTKKLSLIFMITSVICAIPIIGALIGLVLIAGIIGSSIKYGNSVLAKVTALSIATAIAYIAVATTLMINGHFLLSFIACTVVVYVALTLASKIQDSEALELSKVAVADDHCLNFKAVNL